MTTMRQHCHNVLEEARRGAIPVDDDLDRLPRTVAEALAAAGNRIAALAAAGHQGEATQARQRAVEDINNLFESERISPVAAMPRRPAPERTDDEVIDLVRSGREPVDADVAEIVDAVAPLDW